MKNQLKPMQTPAQPQLEVNHSEEKLTFKTSTISNVFSIVLLPIIPTITVLYLSKDMIISATTYGISLLFIVLFIFILKQEILVDSSGIKKSLLFHF